MTRASQSGLPERQHQHLLRVAFGTTSVGVELYDSNRWRVYSRSFLLTLRWGLMCSLCPGLLCVNLLQRLKHGICGRQGIAGVAWARVALRTARHLDARDLYRVNRRAFGIEYVAHPPPATHLAVPGHQ